MTTVRTIALSDLRLDRGTQVRVSLNDSVVAEYAELMLEVVFPPVVAFDVGGELVLAEGFHRVAAAQRLGRSDILAEVHTGTRTDALWFALKANRTNGVRLTAADTRNAIRIALSAFPDRSSSHLAHQVGCSATYVQQVRDAEVPTSGNPVVRVVGSDGVSYPASRAASQSIKSEAERLLREGKSVREVRKATGIGRDAAQRLRQKVRPLDQTPAAVEQSQRAVSSDAGAPNRIVSSIVVDAENLLVGADEVDVNQLQMDRIPEWVASLKKSRDNLTAFIRRLGQRQ